MGMDPGTIRRAFHYQQLHGNIRGMVEQGNLSYYSACQLTQIPEKTEQRRILKTVTDSGEASSGRVRKAVREYVDSLKDDDFWRKKQAGGKGRCSKLVDLAFALSELAQDKEIPDKIKEAYQREFQFGKDYLIPTPFDPRLCEKVSTAVANAAIKDGVIL